MARMLGKGTVLPDLPHSPNMPTFDEVSLVRDTLPAHNAREMISQGLTQTGPRPAAPIINMPQINVPQSQAMSELEQIMGGGFGQGIVPNGPRPAPSSVTAPAISLDQSYLSQDYNLKDYDLTWDGLSPEGQYLRPTSPLELYNFDSGPDVSGLNRIKPEELMGKINAHQPQANTGGDPVFEAEMATIRPTNPRQFFKAGPEYNIPATPQQIAVRDLPVMPAPTTPNIPNIGKLVGPVKPIKMEMQYVAPPIRGADLGGSLNSTSKVGGVANFNGRTVGMTK